MPSPAAAAPHLRRGKHHLAALPLRRRLVHLNGPAHRARRCSGRKKWVSQVGGSSGYHRWEEEASITGVVCAGVCSTQAAETAANGSEGPRLGGTSRRAQCWGRSAVGQHASPPTVLSLRDLGLGNILLDQGRLNVLRQ